MFFPPPFNFFSFPYIYIFICFPFFCARHFSRRKDAAERSTPIPFTPFVLHLDKNDCSLLSEVRGIINCESEKTKGFNLVNVVGDDFQPAIISILNMLPSAVGMLIGNDFKDVSAYFDHPSGNVLVFSTINACEDARKLVVTLGTQSLSVHPAWKVKVLTASEQDANEREEGGMGVDTITPIYPAVPSVVYAGDSVFRINAPMLQYPVNTATRSCNLTDAGATHCPLPFFIDNTSFNEFEYGNMISYKLEFGGNGNTSYGSGVDPGNTFVNRRTGVVHASPEIPGIYEVSLLASVDRKEQNCEAENNKKTKYAQGQ